MIKLRELIRSTVISLEFLVIIIFIYIGVFHPKLAYYIDSIFSKEADKLKWLALIPCGILVWTVNLVRKIRFPEKDKKTLLQKWENYWDVRLLCNIAIFYAFIFACAGALAWIGVSISALNIQGFILLGSILGALIVGASCYLAEMAINDEFGKED